MAAAASSHYDRLRAAILAMDYLPGETLTERSLEAGLEVSRTPIRAALLRLEAEGLVRRVGRGWTVAPIDIAEIMALVEYREAIEVAGVRLSAERASDADLDALLGSLETEAAPATEEEGIRAGGEFHTVLAGLSGNRIIADAMSNVMDRLLRTRWLEVRSEASRIQAVNEHRGIVAALLRRDADLAAELTSAHARGTAARTLAVLAEERKRLRARGFAIVDGQSGASGIVLKPGQDVLSR